MVEIEQERILRVVAQCNTCIPPKGNFVGAIRTVSETGYQGLLVEDYSDDPFSLAAKLLEHHKEMKLHHNSFTLLDDSGRRIGECGLGGNVGILTGLVEDVDNQTS